MPFELPKLKYQYAGLEPYIDAQTVEIHYSKHHQAYANNLNKALEAHAEFAEWPIEKLLTDLKMLPEDLRTVVKNNGGGFYNHNLYWATLGRDVKKEPAGKLAEEMVKAFGSFANLKTQMSQNGLARFGSGWSWLVVSKGGLKAYSTPNQDSPFLTGDTPLFGIDVWEHAYYLKYQNRRNEYMENLWNIVDWDAIERLYEQS